MDPLLRILDANANRAREALRVLEDCARFAANDQALSANLKHLRHDLAAALALLPMHAALQSRDTPHDVGTTNKTPAEFHRPGLADILTANAKRLTEALRSLEECAKAVTSDAGVPTGVSAHGPIDHAHRSGAPQPPEAPALLENLRYRAYTLEQTLMASFHATSAETRFRHVRLYVLLTESLCKKPWQAVLDDILAAPPGTPQSPSPLCIQLREKELPGGDTELLRRAQHLADRCRQAHALAILNDRPDLTRLSNSHGTHVGQTDLPLSALRQLLPPEAIVGISTENLDQARAALPHRPTYIAVGPMFPTTTKFKPRLAGPAYAAQAIREIQLPLVAIGGITLDNLPQVLATGVRTIAVSSAILQSENPGQATRDFLAALPRTEVPTAVE